jgi:GNAT superfamily N-acetyltransferase
MSNMERCMSPLRLRVSIAKQTDAARVARLCRRAVGRSDYILRILPTIIARGGLFLAWDGNSLVGMTNLDRCMDESGWLSMARTDPDWRRRGVAIFLQKKIAAYAKRHHMSKLRLWVSSENKPSLNACKKGGFREVCEAAHMTCRLRGKTEEKVRPTFPSRAQGSPLLKSSYLAKTRGYIGYKRRFMKLTKPLLSKLCKGGQLYLAGDAAFLVSSPERLFREPQSSLTILRGPMAKTLNHAKEIARSKGARILSTYIPYSAYERSVARRLGFVASPWGRHCIVFEN